METMRGLWLENGRVAVRGDLARPSPADGEALVRTRLAGVCATDLALVDGMYGFEGIPGHEFVGVVEAGPEQLLGRRVVADINVSCGRCDNCRAGRAKHCERRRVVGIRGMNGAFAEWITVPVENLYPVHDHVSDRCAVFAEPLAAALDVPRRVLVGATDAVLVVGAGRLGQLVARVLAGQCRRIDVLARSESKLARLPPEVGRLSSSDARTGYDVVVDCSGTAPGFSAALERVRPEGTLVVKSTIPGETPVDLTRAVVDEIRIVGSRCGPLPEALALMAGGGLDLEALVDASIGLGNATEALRQASLPDVIKVLIDPGR